VARVRRTVANTAAAPTCTLTPEVTAGPYYIVNAFTRRNIAQNQPGLPLQLQLAVQDASTCQPIGGADVEIWHANAHGVYSGYGAGGRGVGGGPPGGGPGGGGPGAGGPGGGGHASPTNSKRFLRGHQVSDAQGNVTFDTIYPGWYSGRAPHIHLKVHVGGRVVHTGQLFFDDATSRAVYRRPPYKAHGRADTTNAQDSIYAAAGAAGAQVKLTRLAGSHGFSGALALGVRR
jgi:protocatechuate 3,4-dioxygenase beta subunit